MPLSVGKRDTKLSAIYILMGSFCLVWLQTRCLVCAINISGCCVTGDADRNRLFGWELAEVIPANTHPRFLIKALGQAACWKSEPGQAQQSWQKVSCISKMRPGRNFYPKPFRQVQKKGISKHSTGCRGHCPRHGCGI